MNTLGPTRISLGLYEVPLLKIPGASIIQTVQYRTKTLLRSISVYLIFFQYVHLCVTITIIEKINIQFGYLSLKGTFDEFTLKV